MRKVLILEDNRVTAQCIKKAVYELEEKSEIFVCDNLKDAYQHTVEKRIDLFVVDIILDTSRPGDASGLRFVERIRKIERYAFTPVIFVTSLEDSRLYTYGMLHCYSFLEKPFDVAKLKALLQRCMRFPEVQEEKRTLYFRKDGIILAVDNTDIVYVESVNHMMNIHTVRGDVMNIPYMTLKKLLADADFPHLLQCSRNTAVNKSFVELIDLPNRIIRLKGNLGDVEIGIRYKNRVREVFQ